MRNALTLSLKKNTCFCHDRGVDKFNHRGHQKLAKQKRRRECVCVVVVVVVDPSELNSVIAPSFQWWKAFIFLCLNESNDGYNDQIWYFSIIYHTAFLRNERGVTQSHLLDSHNLNVIKVLMLVIMVIISAITRITYGFTDFLI